MSSYDLPRGPHQPQALDVYNRPKARLRSWMNSLPESAFQMKGRLQDVPTKTPQPDDRRRILYSDCPHKAVPAKEKLEGWPSVSYQVARPGSWGLEGFNGVIVAYHMPADGLNDSETFYVGVPTDDWLEEKLDVKQARNFVLLNLNPLGWARSMPVLRIEDFLSIQKQEIDKTSPEDGVLGSRLLTRLFGRAK
ncbi:hypothetical protein FRC00_008671 [Tulasnella sp. 408]|nr:hypothetical protein FRC00_008671 [Tulasnella sp. 408]